MNGESSKQLESEAISRAFAEHRPAIERFAFGWLRNAEQAADVTQTVFAKLLEQSGLSDDAGTTDTTRIRPWLFRVAYNEAMLLRRKAAIEQRTIQAIGQESSSLGMTGSNVGDSTSFENREYASVALAQLPIEQRTIVLMRINDNQKFSEIAQKLNLPLGTVLTRMRAALGRLRNKLKSDLQ